MSDSIQSAGLPVRIQRERFCFQKLLDATGCKEGQDAFFAKAPKIIDAWTAFFGGKAHIDSPPNGLSEKVVVSLRYVERDRIDELVEKMLASLPVVDDGGVWYFGSRVRGCPDVPEVVAVPFEVNGSKVDGFAADLELFAGISLVPQE